jgi:hypothetical protein
MFRIWRQTRTGLLSYPLDVDAARAHLAANIYLQMALQPDIVHIVGHTEADHAANAAEIIEAAKMARRVIENSLHGAPNMTRDPLILRRKQQLISEAQLTLQAIRSLAPSSSRDPLSDPAVLAKAVTSGILDAPQLKNNPFGRGEIRTTIIAGACWAVNGKGEALFEADRLQHQG